LYSTRTSSPRARIVPAVDADPASTRERILDAAERTIRRLGIDRFGMRDVATAAGRSRGSVYRYFPDRDTLVEAVLRRSAERFVARSEGAVRTQRTLAAQVAEAAVFIRAHLHDEVLTLQLRGTSETLFASLLTANLAGVVDRWIDFWQPFLAEAAARGEIRPRLDRREAAEWIVRLMLSLAVMPSAVVDLDDPVAVRAYVARYIVRGLAP
jgi:AcrR family transcriptional regulator